MAEIQSLYCSAKKKDSRAVNRQYNTALYLLRCVELGLTYDDMENLTYGMVEDMFIEKSNDSCEYEYIATQSDFDSF